MTIQQIINNLKGTDAAFDYSVENNDTVNMQMVLRAYGYDHDYDFAQQVIDAAK